LRNPPDYKAPCPCRDAYISEHGALHRCGPWGPLHPYYNSRMSFSLFGHAPFPSLSAQRARLNKLWADAQNPPPSGALPLRVAGVRCGWMTPRAQTVLTDVSGCGVDAAGRGWDIGRDLSPGPALDEQLRRVAVALREAGCLPGWRDELLDVLDGDRVFGHIERAATRPLGLLTRAVHLNAWTPDGQIWIARRSLSKTTAPGQWDTLVGGLAGSGETLDQALVRECDEEAGLDPADIVQRSPLRVIGRVHFRIPDGYQVEEVLTSDCVLADTVRPANRDGEVMEIRHAPVAEILAMVDAGLFTQEAVLVLLDDILRCARQ